MPAKSVINNLIRANLAFPDQTMTENHDEKLLLAKQKDITTLHDST